MLEAPEQAPVQGTAQEQDDDPVAKRMKALAAGSAAPAAPDPDSALAARMAALAATPAAPATGDVDLRETPAPAAPIRLAPVLVKPTPARVAAETAADQMQATTGRAPASVTTETSPQKTSIVTVGRPLAGRQRTVDALTEGRDTESLGRLAGDPNLGERVANRLAMARSHDGVSLARRAPTFPELATHTALDAVAHPILGAVADESTRHRTEEYTQAGGQIEPWKANLLGALAAGGEVAGVHGIGKALGAGAGLTPYGAEGVTGAASEVGGALYRRGAARAAQGAAEAAGEAVPALPEAMAMVPSRLTANAATRAGALKAIADVAAQHQVHPSRVAKLVSDAAAAMRARGPQLAEAGIAGAEQAAGGAVIGGVSAAAQGERDPMAIAKEMGVSAAQWGLLGAGFSALSAEAQYRAAYRAVHDGLTKTPDLAARVADETLARASGEPGPDTEGQTGPTDVVRTGEPPMKGERPSAPAPPAGGVDPLAARMERLAPMVKRPNATTPVAVPSVRDEPVPAGEPVPPRPAPAPASEGVAAPAAPAQAGTPVVMGGSTRHTLSGKAPSGKMTPIDVRNAGVGVRNEAQERLHALIAAANPGDGTASGRAAQAIGDMIDGKARLARALRDRGVKVTPEIEAQADHLEQIDRATRMADFAAGVQPWKHVQRARDILRAQGMSADEIGGLSDTDLIERAFEEAPSSASPAAASAETRRIASVAHGHTHLDTIDPKESVGREIRSVHDQTETGKIVNAYGGMRVVQWTAGPLAGQETNLYAPEAGGYVVLPVSPEKALKLKQAQAKTAEQEKAKVADEKKPAPKKLEQPIDTNEWAARAMVDERKPTPDYTGAESGLEAYLTPHAGGLTASFRDKDSGEWLSSHKWFPKMSDAHAYARKVVGRDVEPASGGTLSATILGEEPKKPKEKKLRAPKKEGVQLEKAPPGGFTEADKVPTSAQSPPPRIPKFAQDILGDLAVIDASPAKLHEGSARGERLRKRRATLVNQLRAFRSSGVVAPPMPTPPSAESAPETSTAFKHPTGLPPHLDTPAIRALREQQAAIQPPADTPERIQWRVKEATDLAATAHRFEKRIDIGLGLPGSGKSSILRDPLVQGHGGADLDADVPKQHAPEYANGLGAKALLDESSAIRHHALELAMAQGANIFYPTIGGKTAGTVDLARELLAVGYQVHVHFVDVPPDVAARRSTDGFLRGGRHFVDPADTFNIGNAPRLTYAALVALPGVHAHDPIDNNVPHGSAPRAVPDWRAEWGFGDSGLPEDAADAGAGRPGRGRAGGGVAAPASPGEGVAHGAPADAAGGAERPGGAVRGGASPVPRGEPAGPVSGDEGAGDAGRPLPERGGERGDAVRRPDGSVAPGGGTAPIVRGEAVDSGLGPRAGGQPSHAGSGAGAGGTRGAGSGLPARVAPPVTAATATAPRAATPENGTVAENFRITEDTELAVGGPKARIAQNLAAIRLARALAAEGRVATHAEQLVLAKYVGWGDSALAKVFDDFSDTQGKWAAERAELQAVLSPEEYRAASASTKNAHYTSPEIIRGVYRALDHMGVKPGGAVRLLEPAAGVGHFLGLVPEGLNPQATLVELDPTTASIAKGLYPLADVRAMGIQDAKIPKGHYDLIVGNPPFGSYQVADKEYDKHKLRIHDYFFVKSLDHLRPGGILAFVSSNGTMDKADSGARKLMAERADFLGAVRLPNTAFKGNAGTDVVTDVLFFRKPLAGEAGGAAARADRPAWLNTTHVPTGRGQTMRFNEYYVAHPENVLGEHSLAGSMYAGDTYTVAPREGVKSGPALEEAMVAALQQSLPAGVYQPAASAPPPLTRDDWRDELAPSTLREGWLRVGADGTIEKNERGKVVPAKVAKAAIPKVTKLIAIREAITQLRAIQLDPSSPEPAFKKALAAANALYDEFVRKHGPINSEKITEGVYQSGPNAGKEYRTIRRPNLDPFKADPSYPVVAALEDFDAATGTARKADILTRRILSVPAEITHVDTPADAIGPVLNKLGRLDLPYMAKLAGTTVEAVANVLRGAQAFEDPATQTWALADDYLSGNVKAKLAQAERAAAEAHERYGVNVDALKKVIPKDLEPSEIYLKLGSPWVSAAHYARFATETFKGAVTVKYVDAGGGSFHVDADSRARSSAATTTEYGTDKAHGIRILQDALNQRATEITYKDADGKSHKDAEATIAAQAKQEALKQRFQEWAWEEAERARDLAETYNRLYNHSVAPNVKGDFLEIPGTASHVRGIEFKWSWWQKDAIWRMLTKGNTGLFHVVGGGKTFIMIGAGMEGKRLGLFRKPLYVVPNHMLEQFSREFLQLYPNANILIATKKDFAKAKRREFTAKMASHDWDGIIMTHRSFESVGVSAERQQAFIEREMDKLEQEIRESKKDKSDRQIVKALETALSNLEVKLDRLMSREKKDDLLSFEETGVDQMFVDEAHLFKNLAITSKMRGMATKGSQRAFDLLMKTQYLEEQTPGRGVTLATGTPISNSMAEAYTVQRYLQPQALLDAGISNFDDWAATFGESVTQAELAPDGSGYRSKERFAKFQNIPELITMFRQVADVKNAEDIFPPDAPGAKSRRPPVLAPGQPIMAAKGKPSPGTDLVPGDPAAIGKPTMVLSPASLALKGIVRSLIRRAEKVRAKLVDPSEDNFLKITTEGRLAAMDLRLVSPHGFADPNGKIAKAADQIARLFKETASVRGAQLVFSDIGTPKGAKEQTVVVLDDEGNEVHVLALIEPEEGDAGIGGEGMGVPGFNVYADLRQLLVERGVPVKQIAFIHDAKNDLQKQQIMDDVKAGKIRVLIGSTEKMGAGMNVQDRLVALHHLDAPWRPSDIEQREGRIVRQGNRLWNEGKINGVGLYRYGTEESFDAYMWQTLERKAGFIGPVMKGDSKVRTIDDLDSRAMDLAEMKAATSGNPLVKEKNEVDVEVHKLTLAQRQHRDAQVRVRAELASLATRLRGLADYRAGAVKDAAHVEAHDLSGDNFTVTISGRVLTDREKATEALRAAAAAAIESGLGSSGEARLGNIASLPIKLVRDGSGYDKASDQIVAKYAIAIEGAAQLYQGQSFSAKNVPVHPIASVEGMYRSIPGTPQRYAETIERLTEQQEGYRAQVGKPFTGTDRLAELRERQAELEKVLGKEDEKNREEPIVLEGSAAWWTALRNGEWPYRKPDAADGPLQAEPGQIPPPPKQLGDGSGGGMQAMAFADPLTAAYKMWQEARRLRALRLGPKAPLPLAERPRALAGTPHQFPRSAIGMAAVRFPDGRIFLGGDHAQAFTHAHHAGVPESAVWDEAAEDFRRDVAQGHIDGNGRFKVRPYGSDAQFGMYGFADPITAAAYMLYRTKPVQATIGKAAKQLAALNASLQVIFNASNVSPGAGQASRIIRPNRAQMDRDVAKAHQAVEETRAALDRLSSGAHYDGPRWQWYHDMEAGNLAAIPHDLVPISNTARKIQDDVAKEIRALGPGHLDSMIEHYMGRVYKAGPKIRGTPQSQVGRALGKRPMDGRKAFKKKRSFKTLQDALDAGYEPITENPLDMVLLKVREMRRYLMAQRIKAELKDTKLVKFKKASRPMPDGYAKINDGAFTVFAPRGAEGETRIRGEYVAPVEIARVVNNFLSPGLRGNVIYDSYSYLGNTLNMVQLGVSAFHLGLVAFDATAQLAAVGLDQVLTGKGPGGRLSGAKKLLGATVSAASGPLTVLPLGPLLAQYWKGRQVWHAYFHDAASAEMAQILEGLIAGGGRAKMDDYYRTNNITAFRAAFRDKRWASTILHFPFAVLEGSMYPLLEHIVPRMKMGAIAQMLQVEIAKLPAGASEDEIRVVAARVVDAIDARLGQMIYDNRFWHRATKEIMMAGIRSVGWDVGSLDVTVGAGVQLYGNIKQLMKGERPDSWHKVQYLAAVAAMVGLYGAMYTYLHTGERPKGWKDYYYPRTGSIDKDGNAERMTPATYMKDVFAMGRHPITTLEHKLHPLLNTAAEILANRDFYGNMLHNEDASFPTQREQDLAYIVHDVLKPFTLRNIEEAKKRNAGTREKIEGFLGNQVAPREVVRSPAQNKMADFLSRRGRPTLTPEQQARSEERQDIADGLRDKSVGRDSLRLLVRRGELTPGQATRSAIAARQDPLVVRFKLLSPEEAQAVYDLGDEREKALWEKPLRLKLRRLRRLGVASPP